MRAPAARNGVDAVPAGHARRARNRQRGAVWRGAHAPRARRLHERAGTRGGHRVHGNARRGREAPRSRGTTTRTRCEGRARAVRPSPRAVRLLLRTLSDERATIVHTHGYRGDILLGWLPHFIQPAPLVTTVHGYTDVAGTGRLRAYAWLDRRTPPRFDRVVLVHAGMRSFPGLQRHGDPRWIVIENGIAPPPADTAPRNDTVEEFSAGTLRDRRCRPPFAREGLAGSDCRHGRARAERTRRANGARRRWTSGRGDRSGPEPGRDPPIRPADRLCRRRTGAVVRVRRVRPLFPHRGSALDRPRSHAQRCPGRGHTRRGWRPCSQRDAAGCSCRRETRRRWPRPVVPSWSGRTRRRRAQQSRPMRRGRDTSAAMAARYVAMYEDLLAGRPRG